MNTFELFPKSFCQCDHEAENNLPRTRFCTIQCRASRMKNAKPREVTLDVDHEVIKDDQKRLTQ